MRNHDTLHDKCWANADADSSSTPSTDSDANSHSTDSSTSANSAANTSPAAANTGPVLHWWWWRVQCPLLLGRMVWLERIQLRGMRWALVRRPFTDASSTNTCREPNSYTSSSDASSFRPKSVLLRPGVHRQLRCRWMVRWGRGQLCRLRGRMVQFSSGARAQLHDEAIEGPRGMSELQ